MERLTVAYERLLAELAADLHAMRATLDISNRAGTPPPETIARFGRSPGPASSLAWLELPVHEGTTESAWLRMGFEPATPIPPPDEPHIVQAVAELVVLLSVSGWHEVSLPAYQACKRILAVTEEELQHIILDIHDGPVQKLFAASSQLELMRARLEGMPEGAGAVPVSDLERVAALLQASLNEIKNTLGTLRPPEFRRRPLVSVMQGLLLQHETLTGMRVELTVEGEVPTVSLPVKIALYRILQEALSNAYRHANVDRVDVCLHAGEEWVTLEMVDGGKGFEPPPLEGPSGTEREEHIGLRGMRDRAQLVGGQIRLTSHPGEGTRIEVRVPADG